ncbi:MAG: Crp/Fnr family transcriptional regulator [Clostridia bacterium]|nr:Crp/Fnr family transcriptional regulator [Clostridia bacterium]
MEKYMDILKQCILFQNIRDEDLSTMLHCIDARVILFDKKYTILAEGYPAKYMGIVLSGSAQIQRMDYFGNRSVVSNVEPGETFGETFACAQVDAVPVEVIANEPCAVMLIDAAHILHPCENHCSFHQQLIFNLMKAMAIKNLQLHQSMEITAQRTTREKLMTYLNFQAKRANSTSFEIPFDRQALADYLQVDRSGLSAEISKLRREGVLENHKNHFTLL